jgi:prevent-host-death family protein
LTSDNVHVQVASLEVIDEFGVSVAEEMNRQILSPGEYGTGAPDGGMDVRHPDSILEIEYTWSKCRVQLGVAMRIQVNIHEAKARLSSLIARAEAGEEVVIARANRPSVRLVPIQKEKLVRRLGEAKGLARIHDDFDDLPAEFMENFS